MIFIVISVLLAVWGVIQLLAGDILWGILLLVLACAVGPGGWTIVGRNKS